MPKNKTILSVIIALLILFAACGMTGCGQRKYDVEIEIIFTDSNAHAYFIKGIDEERMHLYYDGKEHEVYVAAYKMPGHPEYKYRNYWTPYTGKTPNVIYGSFLYTAPDGTQHTISNVLKERGEYMISYSVDSGSTLWKQRFMTLYIDMI